MTQQDLIHKLLEEKFKSYKEFRAFGNDRFRYIKPGGNYCDGPWVFVMGGNVINGHTFVSSCRYNYYKIRQEGNVWKYYYLYQEITAEEYYKFNGRKLTQNDVFEFEISFMKSRFEDYFERDLLK